MSVSINISNLNIIYQGLNIPLTPFKGIAVKLSIVLLQERIEEVSPPFEGGVAGMIDDLTFTRFISRPGWLISLSARFISFI
ncbi:MAG TPA: hypothetical protein DD745_08455 [Bacteroidales bacterium]|nr:hypothetical protein [Bacteroidales bacterium]